MQVKLETGTPVHHNTKIKLGKSDAFHMIGSQQGPNSTLYPTTSYANNLPRDIFLNDAFDYTIKCGDSSISFYVDGQLVDETYAFHPIQIPFTNMKFTLTSRAKIIGLDYSDCIV